MPYLFIGIILLIVSVYFLRMARKDGDQEGIVGMTAIMMASIILTVIFGLLYRSFFP